MLATVTGKGQVTVPKEIRDKTGITLGSRLVFEVQEDGPLRVMVGDKVLTLNRDESTYIPKETRHRLENPGTEPLHLIEVQSGDYLGEDDIVRFEDRYKRT